MKGDPLKTLSAACRLVRFEHAIMFAISVYIAEVVAYGGIPPMTVAVALSLFIPVLSEMGAFAMNDLFDIKSDILNGKRERPLVSGELTPEFARNFTAASFLLAILLAYFVNPTIFWITVGVNVLAMLYNLRLKDLPLVGNIYIAATMALPFIFGSYVFGSSIAQTNLYLALLGFTVGLGREIVKTVEDMGGDKKARKSKTLPMLIGSEKSLTIAGMVYIAFVLISLMPYYTYFIIGKGFLLVLAADAVFMYIALKLIFSRRKNTFLKIAKTASLAALFVGLVGILISVIGY